MRAATLVGVVAVAAIVVAAQTMLRHRGKMARHEGQEDSFYKEILAKPDNQDIAEWRKGGEPVLLGEQSAQTSAAVLDALFAAGAVRIVATEVEKDPRFGLATNWIVIELPTDRAMRRNMTALLKRLSKKNGWDDDDDDDDDSRRYALMGKFKHSFRWP